jgi:hypothetical protein
MFLLSNSFPFFGCFYLRVVALKRTIGISRFESGERRSDLIAHLV